MKAVPYLRVSTDNKGQDPLRQLEVIEPWAEREAVHLLDPAVDDGTSASKTNPFERPEFIGACKRAQAEGAEAIVVETADRFTRQGSKEDGWAEVELGRRYGLKLLRADKTLAQHGSMVGDVTDALKAEVAREWVREHSKKVRSGMVKAKKEGKSVGRPEKPLTEAEIELADELHENDGLGWRRVALELSKRRGAFEVADPAAQRRLKVSAEHVRTTLNEWYASAQ